MSIELMSIEQVCEEVRISLQSDNVSLRELRMFALASSPEEYEEVSMPIKQTVERIKQVIRCLLGEDIEIGDPGRVSDRPTFIAWRGSIDERVERSHPFIEKHEKLLRTEVEAYEENPHKAIETMKTTAPENSSCYHAFAFWLCYRRNIDEYEAGCVNN